MLGLNVKSNGISGRKLVLDLSDHCDRGVCMDDSEELVALLCTRIGIIMEDASVVALTIGSLSQFERGKALVVIRHATIAIHRLMEAAIAVSD